MVADRPAGDIIMTTILGGGTMQTMPIVKVRDLAIALAAYIAQIRRTE